jgi:nucleotide-binding universal stress UspA family protein
MDPEPPSVTASERPRRIVVAYDGSEPSARAVRFALDTWAGGDVWIVHATDPPRAVAEPRTEEEQGSESDAIEQGLRAIQTEAGRGGTRVHVWIREGRPAAVILGAAAEVDAALIVVGTRGLRAAGRLLLGSVSNEIVVHSRRPVAVVP